MARNWMGEGQPGLLSQKALQVGRNQLQEQERE